MSQNTNHPLDQHFREHLEGHSSSLPPHLEERIMERVRKSPSRRSPFWMERVALILFLCTVGLFQAPDLQEAFLLPEEWAAPASPAQPDQAIKPSSALTELPQLELPGWNELRVSPGPTRESAPATVRQEVRPQEALVIAAPDRKGMAPLTPSTFPDMAAPALSESPAKKGPNQDLSPSKKQLAMVIKMPSKGYFAKERPRLDSAQQEAEWWRYAHHQFHRILRGDKPELPAWKSEPFLAFNLPSKSSIFKLPQ